MSLPWAREDAGARASLEAHMAEVTGCTHAVAVPMARTGIYLAIKAVIQRGQNVLLSPLTIPDVVNMVIAAGGVPRFVDVESSTCNLDPAQLESAIDPDTGAVLVTHLHGLVCDNRAIERICERHGVPMLQDAAQALGARVDGDHVGRRGKATVFSFGLYKHVTGLYGGMVTTDDDEVAMRLREEMTTWRPASRLRLLERALQGLVTDILTRTWLFRWLTFPLFRFGAVHDVDAINRFARTDLSPVRMDALPETYKTPMRAIQCRMVLGQLQQLADDTEARIQSAALYRRDLDGVERLELPPSRSDLSHIYTCFPILVTEREVVVREAMRQGLDIARSNLPNCAALQCFEAFAADCPVAEEVAHTLVPLPTYPGYTPHHVERATRVLKAALGVV